MSNKSAQLDLLSEVCNLTIINQLVETHCVEESIGQIEVSKTIKDHDAVRHINETIDYKLKQHRLIIKKHKHNSVVISDLPISNTISSNKSTCECISSDINQIFINELKSFKNIQTFEYDFFKQSFFKRIFNPNTDEKLTQHIIDLGKDCSWIIVPTFLYEIIVDSEWFQPSNMKEDSLIFNVGKLDEIQVYLNPDEDESVVYFGNYDSTTILINKNIQDEDLKICSLFKEGRSLIVEYLFLETGRTKLLKVS